MDEKSIIEKNQQSVKSSYQRKEKYRSLLAKVEDLQEAGSTGAHSLNTLNEVFKDLNTLDESCNFEDRVEHLDETLLNFQVLSTSSEMYVDSIKNADIFASEYNAAEFGAKILEYVQQNNNGNEGFELNCLLDDARAIINDVPKFEFLYGAFDPTVVPEPKQKKQRQRQAQEKLEKKQPERIQTVASEEDSIEQTVNFLERVLREECEKNGDQPISYFKYIVDSEDFCATVENNFYSAFLIRDGKARLIFNDQGVPLIEAVRKSDLKAFRKEGGTNTQAIISFTMDQWEEMRVTEGYIQRHKRQSKSNTK